MMPTALRVRAWKDQHPKTRRLGERYGCKAAPVARGTTVLVEVSRILRETRNPKKMWMWWTGEASRASPGLDLIWRGYRKRFRLEHDIKLLKLALEWTAPRLRHPEQADLWAWLILAAYTQLRLARSIVADRRLPRVKPLSQKQLAPTRVLRVFATPCWICVHWRVLRNPADALPDDPKVVARDRTSVTQR